MVTQDQAEALLSQHKERLFDCITSGVADYSKYPPKLRQEHTPRTRASIRHDHIVGRIKAAFDGVSGVEVIELRGLVLLLVGNILAIRFNKLSEDGKCHSNATEQTSLFHNQQPLPQQEELPGIPAHATHLVGGYALNQLGTISRLQSRGQPWHLLEGEQHVLAAPASRHWQIGNGAIRRKCLSDRD